MAGQTSNTKFKPGQSGNLKGRPKREWTWAGLYEDAVDKYAGKGKEKVKEVVAKRLADLASTGDIVAIKELANRMDGMPKQSTDITSGGKKIKGLVNVK